MLCIPDGDSRVKIIAEALKDNETINELILWSMFFLFRKYWTKLINFIIGSNIRDKGAEALAEALKKNKALKRLSLWGLFIIIFIILV